MRFINLLKRKKLLFFVIILVGAAVIYWAFFTGSSKTKASKYVLGAATNGSIITSVAGSGQVTAESQVDIKPQVSGKILSLKIKENENVKAGQVLAVIDNTDALNSVKDAELSLQQAKLSLANIQKPADELSIKQALDQYNQAQRDLNTLNEPVDQADLDKATHSVQEATRKLEQIKSDYESQKLNGEQSLEKAYNDAYNAVFDAITNLHKYTDDMVDIYNDKTVNNGDYLYAMEYELGLGNLQIANFKDDLGDAQILLTKSNYQTITKPDDKTLIKQQLIDSRDLAETIYQALGSARVLIKTLETRDLNQYIWGPLIEKISPVIDQDIVEVGNSLDNLDSASRNLDLAILNTPASLQSAQDAIIAAESNLQDRQNTLDKLKEVPTDEELATAREKVQEKLLSYQKIQNPDSSYEVSNQKLTVKQRENALAKAKQTLADYTVKAPFNGKIATLAVRLGDTVSSGTTVATIISDEYLAEVSLNEVDVPKVKTDNKVTITLDAFPEDTLTGKVISIDSIGMSSQGVVDYTAKISFDNIIDGVKPGMTVSSTIITSVKQDILLVPVGAVKTSGETSYVEYFDPLPADYDETTLTLSSAVNPQTKEVTTGLSDDTSTEIISGLSEGDLLVTQTVSASSASGSSKASSGKSSAVSIPGITGGFGGGGPPG